MDLQNLRFYFGEIERIHPNMLYLVNRNSKRDPTDVPIDDYPIPSYLQMVDDRPWLLGRTLRERTYVAKGASFG